MAIARAQAADDGNTKQNFLERISSLPKRIRDYFGELQTEMHRVTWPNWKQVRATTAVVIAAVFMFSAYFFVVDWAVGGIIGRILKTLGGAK